MTLRKAFEQQVAGSLHEGRTDNPHATTKAQVGLSEATNTSDQNKPVSVAQAAALANKADLVLVNGAKKIPTSQIPAVSLISARPVADRAAMLALDVQPGDVAVISTGADRGTYMLTEVGASTVFTSWLLLSPGPGTVQSVNGESGTVVLDAADVGAVALTDFTEAVQDAVAAMLVAGAGVTLVYDDATGKITLTGGGSGDPETVRDTVAAALRGTNGVTITVDDAGDTVTVGINATDLSETIQDNVAAMLVAGSGIGLSYDDGLGKITLTATGGTGGTDPEAVRDTIAAALRGTGGVTVTANDAGDTITLGINLSQVTDLAEAIQDTMASTLVAGSGVGLTYDDTTGKITLTSAGGSGGSTDPEVVRDTIAAALRGTSGVVLTSDDNGDTITFSIDLTGITALAETIQDTVAAMLVDAAGTNLPYSDTTGKVTVVGGTSEGGVTSVNDDTGPNVSIDLGKVVGVVLTEEILDENGMVATPGPVPGEFLGFDDEGVARNLPVNKETLGLDAFYSPKDPNAEYVLYGAVVPLGGTPPTTLPDIALIIDENRPETGLFSDAHVVAAAGTAQTLPSPMTATKSFLTLTASTAVAITFPPAPTTAGVVEIEVSLDQPATGTGGTATWPSNVRWDKRADLSAPYVPVLEPGNGARNTFRFRGAMGVWECIGRWLYPGADVVQPKVPGPTPTVVSTLAAHTGLSNTSPSLGMNYGPTVNANDVLVLQVSLAGNTTEPSAAGMAALGFTLLDGPITNSDGLTPTLRTWLYKRKMTGTEDNEAFTIDFVDSVDGTVNTERCLAVGEMLRGADFDRVSWQTLRDITVDTTFDIPTITPVVNNSLLVALNAARHGVVTGGGTMPSTSNVSAEWTERADFNEGRDSAAATFSGWVGTRPLTGGAGAAVAAATGTFNITATHVCFVVAVAPVNV